MDYDFGGWATKNDITCADGKTIRKNAFSHCDGLTVPLVYSHGHNSIDDVLGHALLENRDEGVYAYAKFNETPAGQKAKLAVINGDLTGLSIYANKLKQVGNDVVHGMIREVSLVLAGANPGAKIDSVLCHGDDGEWDDEATIIFPDTIEIFDGYDVPGVLEHTEFEEEDPLYELLDNGVISPETYVSLVSGDEIEHSEGETVGDILDSMNDKQKKVMAYFISQALGDDDEDEEEFEMNHNIFDTDMENNECVLQQDEMTAIIADAKRIGSLREAVLQHGITNLEYLFPDYKTTSDTPAFIDRPQGWVSKVMSGVHHTPFSRIKSIYADITADEARARGYIKGKQKVEEVFSLLKRTTDPTTVYKLQKLDRDDIIDITDFNVVSWMKSEMRGKLDEELARAILISDGRNASSDDKINETHIRPIAHDDNLYTIKVTVTAGANATETAKSVITNIIKARKDYRGSGSPTLFTTEDFLTDMLLITDGVGRDIYDDESKLMKKLRVSNIVTVPVMENTLDRSGNKLIGIIVNLNDYNIGADKGGAVSLFDDFDIEYNKYRYLIETRCSGALTVPYSAIAISVANP